MNKAILSNLSFPEGPAIAPNGDIWFVELHGGNVCRYTPQGVVRRYHINGGSPNGIAIDSKGRIWFCDAGKNCVSILYPESGDVKTACAEVGGEPLANPNDLAFDSKGNLLFTCPGDSRKSPDGYVCVLSRGRAKKFADGKYFPNGLALTPDGNSLVVAETYKQRLWKGGWNPETLEWTNPKIWAETGGIVGPDGMAFGSDGNLYVAVYGSGVVKILSPAGKVIGEISLQGKNPSNCAFLPKGGLLITETEKSELVLFETHICPGRLFNSTELA